MLSRRSQKKLLDCEYEGSQSFDHCIQKVLDLVKTDHVVESDSKYNRFRRTVVLFRGMKDKLGFTLQSYVFECDDSSLPECVTYVDNVELNSPAYFAGVRCGDVILSINGESVIGYSHDAIIRLITGFQTLRLVLLFENCTDKIDLFCRIFRLKLLLVDKLTELQTLEQAENELFEKSHKTVLKF